MGPTELLEQPQAIPSSHDDAASPAPDFARAAAISAAQAGPAPCPTCGAAADDTPPAYVYAIGRVEPRFPRLSVEKEFAQATGRADAAGLADRQALQKVLSAAENRYLVRQLCWVMTIEGLETYILVPRDPADFSLLIEALRPAPLPEACNGLLVPIVAFDQMYSFDRDALIKAIPRPEQTPAREFAAAAGELFDRIMLMTDNAGATDEHRALNYLAVRYPAIYAKTAESFSMNSSLTAVDVQSSSLSGARNIVEVIFSYTHRATDVTDKFFVRVDVTEEFPFLVTKLSPYYRR